MGGLILIGVNPDFVRQFEKVPASAKPDLDIPEAYFLFVDMVIAFDHVQGRSWIIVNPGAREQEMGYRRPEADEWGMLYDRAVERLGRFRAKLATHAADAIAPARAGTPRFQPVPTITRQDFESMVARCKEYIAAGDIYQANLSQRFSVPIGGEDPLRLYRHPAGHQSVALCRLLRFRRSEARQFLAGAAGAAGWQDRPTRGRSRARAGGAGTAPRPRS